jgi:hypothetical protein
VICTTLCALYFFYVCAFKKCIIQISDQLTFSQFELLLCVIIYGDYVFYCPLEGAVDIGCGFDEYAIVVFVYIYLILVIIVGFDPCSHVGPYFKIFYVAGI